MGRAFQVQLASSFGHLVCDPVRSGDRAAECEEVSAGNIWPVGSSKVSCDRHQLSKRVAACC